ncbi:MLO-like protein 8 [Prosopis cineraria]|uniref:MLO-like protein 8 n=1 Tax=Prosopis cineraria TaxID=364024 RepID=UPI00240F8976|nr:MLO-like protein 8 [Prosopis cineraria]
MCRVFEKFWKVFYLFMYCCVRFSELMLLGFISLLLTVTQNGITEINVPAGLTRHMLPCNPDRGEGEECNITHSSVLIEQGSVIICGSHSPPAYLYICSSFSPRNLLCSGCFLRRIENTSVEALGGFSC